MHNWRVDLCFDSKGNASHRVVAIRVEPTLSDDVARVLEGEGLWQDGALWVGPVQYFQAALLRLPDEWSDWAEHLRSTLDLPAPVSRQNVDIRREKTLVMGVLNVTPDSFFDGGRYVRVEQALQRARDMVANGADIIDVGGESTRPNADPVSVEEELSRVIPVIRALSQEIDVPISIDTYKAPVARAALEAGATIVNDISGLQFDPQMATVAAEAGAGVVIMHIKGTPRTMQSNPYYEDVIVEVRDFLARGCEKAIAAGVDETKIWIDPGIGFGKTVHHNLAILSRLRAFRTLGFPILVGTSNKSMIGQVLDVGVDDRTEGTAATVVMSIANGADAIRVHDVKVMGRVAAMTDAIVRGWQDNSSWNR